VKDALGGALGKSLASAPRLDVRSAVFRARQPKRFVTEQRYGFGFHLADIPRGHFGIGKVGLIAVAQELVAALMHQGLKRQSGNGIEGDFATPLGVALCVAIEIFERNMLDL